MQLCHYLDSLTCKKINASSFLALATFAVEYHLVVSLIFRSMQHGVCVIAQLLVNKWREIYLFCR